MPDHFYLSASLSLAKSGISQPRGGNVSITTLRQTLAAKSLFHLRLCHVVSDVAANPCPSVFHPIAKAFLPQVSQTLSQKHRRRHGLTAI